MTAQILKLKPEPENPFENIEPCQQAVSVDSALDDIMDEIHRYIVCDIETSIAASLWVLSTWLTTSTYSPIAIISAPERRCGKSQMLDLFECLVKNPVKADNITPAVLFRIIELYKPTILVDEFDTFLALDTELIGVFNSGVKHNGQSWRCEGRDNVPTAFSTFSSKAIAGIGLPPDTILDRGIPLRLRRKETHEIRGFLTDAKPAYWSHQKSRLARAAIACDELIEDFASQVRDEMPASLNDRQRDCWLPLLTIAKIAGGDWYQSARDTAVKINTAEETMTVNVQLLYDIKAKLDENGMLKFSSADLINWLVNDEDLAWSSFNGGKPLKQYQLSKRLKGFEIQTKTVRLGGGKLLKGFELSDFDDAFSRYLPSAKKATQATQPTHPSIGAASSPIAIRHTSDTFILSDTTDIYHIDDFERNVMAESEVKSNE